MPIRFSGEIKNLGRAAAWCMKAMVYADLRLLLSSVVVAGGRLSGEERGMFDYFSSLLRSREKF